MILVRVRRPFCLAASALTLTACASGPASRMDLLGRQDEPTPVASTGSFGDISYATWSDYEPPYRFYPGDELEVSLPTAPELSKTVTVQPDGRVSLPLIGSVMAADRTIPDLRVKLEEAYGRQLLRPLVEIVPKAAPLKVFVGGEVRNPGIFDMTGDGDALRAVIQAGDFINSADRRQVLIIRRGADGRGMIRKVNLQKGLKSGAADLVPLRRFDIVYVPKSGIANADLAVQQYVRDLSPIQLGFSYALGPNRASGQ
jgi:protein involved in polysaccharide export with SLBB domain